jgi:hypothetical protein
MKLLKVTTKLEKQIRPGDLMILKYTGKDVICCVLKKSRIADSVYNVTKDKCWDVFTQHGRIIEYIWYTHLSWIV